jgi:CheY-like chemotaxis protein
VTGPNATGEPLRSRLLCLAWTTFLPESRLTSLPQTAAGASAFANQLSNTGALVDLPTVMIDQPGIVCLNAVEHLISRSQDSATGVIIYLASHGLMPTSTQQLYRLATGDTREPDDLIRSIPIDEIIKKLRFSRAGLNWLIVDSCYAGRAGASFLGVAPSTATITADDGLCLLASSGPFSSALAPVDQDLTAFTRSLLDALQEGRPQAGRRLSMEQIYKRTKAIAQERGIPSPYLLAHGLAASVPLLANTGSTANETSAKLKELTKYDNRAEILFVDDDKKMREAFKRDLEDAGHKVTTVETPDEVRQLVELRHYDIIVVDLFLVGDTPAAELITYLSRVAGESMILVTSREAMGQQEESWTSLSSVFDYPHRVAAFVFKSALMGMVTEIANRIRKRREAILSRVEGLEQWIPFVSGRLTRRGAVAEALSADLENQTRKCVEQLVARWFGPKSTMIDYIHSLDIEPIDSGRSSCAVFALTPRVQGINPVSVNPLLLKIGPRDDIREEVDRYDKYVQIGVPLGLRTDQVAVAEVGSVGAVIYSFLGATAGSIVEVGELDVDGIEDCLTRIFDPAKKRWYASVSANNGIRLLDFFKERKYDVGRFIRVARTMAESLRSMNLDIGAIDVNLASNEPCMVMNQPATLVHGDLHLGNLLKYDEGRYAMIDYRNVGIGPRLMDFVTLEISCWLLAPAPELPKSELMKQAFTPIAGGGLWLEQKLDGVPTWLHGPLRLAALCRRLAGANFPNITSVEYGSLLWLSAVRRFEFRSTATTAQERRTMRVVPIALALAAQDLIQS